MTTKTTSHYWNPGVCGQSCGVPIHAQLEAKRAEIMALERAEEAAAQSLSKAQRKYNLAVEARVQADEEYHKMADDNVGC